jgi:hypothetical protein
MVWYLVFFRYRVFVSGVRKIWTVPVENYSTIF